MRIKYLIVAAILATGFGLTAIRADDLLPEAPAAAKPGITRVTLHLQSATAQDAFNALAKQGGIKFSTNGNTWDQNGLQTENNIDMIDRPFWSAVNELCGLWNISVDTNNYGGSSNAKSVPLNLFGAAAPGEKTKIPVFESGGFLVQAISFSRQQTVNYAMPRLSRNSCSVQVAVFVDPAIHVSTFDQNPKVDLAVDDAGNSMIPDKIANVLYGGGQQSSLIHQCMVRLKYPPNAGKKIADLKFTITMTASDAVDSLSIDKPLEAAEISKDFGETSLTFHSLKKTGEGLYELKIAMNGGNTQGNNGGWQLLQSAKLLDSSGRAYGYAGGLRPGRAPSPDEVLEHTVRYRSSVAPDQTDAMGDPIKWVIELPTKSHSIKLPVEFKDLALP